jgi:hypothetical protein
MKGEIKMEKISLKRMWGDNIGKSIIMLNVCSYIGWILFMGFVYPMQFKSNGAYNYIPTIGMVGSFVILIFALLCLDRLYKERVDQIKDEDIQREILRENLELEDDWVKVSQGRMSLEDFAEAYNDAELTYINI